MKVPWYVSTIDSYPFDYTEKERERSFHLYTAPAAHRTMLCKNMPAMKTDTVPKRSVVRSSFYKTRTAAVNTDIMAMVKKYSDLRRRPGSQQYITTVLYSQLHALDLTRYNYFISFRSLYVKDHPERMERLPDGVGIYPLASEMNMDLLTMAAQLLKLKGHAGSWSECRLHTAYRREWKKHFGSTEFACVIHYNGYEAYTTALLEEAPCPRSIWVHNDMAREVHVKGNMNRFIF